MIKKKNPIFHIIIIVGLCFNTRPCNAEWTEYAWAAGSYTWEFTKLVGPSIGMIVSQVVLMPLAQEARLRYLFETTVEKVKNEHEISQTDNAKNNSDQTQSTTYSNDISTANQLLSLGLITKEENKKMVDKIKGTLLNRMQQNYLFDLSESATEDNKPKETDPVANEPGLIKKACSAIVPACAVSITFLAEKCGPKKCASWLAASSPYFKDKEAFVSKGLTVTGLAVVGMALYKTYQALTSDDEEEEEENFFDKFNRKKSY